MCACLHRCPGQASPSGMDLAAHFLAFLPAGPLPWQGTCTTTKSLSNQLEFVAHPSNLFTWLSLSLDLGTRSQAANILSHLLNEGAYASTNKVLVSNVILAPMSLTSAQQALGRCQAQTIPSIFLYFASATFPPSIHHSWHFSHTPLVIKPLATGSK